MKQTMKNTLGTLAAALLLSALCACGGKTAAPRVTATPAPTVAPLPTAAPTQKPEPAPTAAPELPTAPEPTAPAQSTELVDGMRPEFKEAMDSYEAFYDQYCAFMQTYSANPTDMSLLAEYGTMLVKMEEMNRKFDAWEEDDLNTAEAQYYIEVNSRITQKLLEVAQ